MKLGWRFTVVCNCGCNVTGYLASSLKKLRVIFQRTHFLQISEWAPCQHYVTNLWSSWHYWWVIYETQLMVYIACFCESEILFAAVHWKVTTSLFLPPCRKMLILPSKIPWCWYCRTCWKYLLMIWWLMRIGWWTLHLLLGFSGSLLSFIWVLTVRPVPVWWFSVNW